MWLGLDDDLAGTSTYTTRTYRRRLRELGGRFDGEESPPPASWAPLRDDYMAILYPPACMAVGGGFRPSDFPMTELEDTDAALVHEFA
ncbi:hypothetical protein Scep_005137 [Stephania cephalantha]|uniref:Uncharacterized protein n=1 Tax=Stephania cephalantha TaxID=152367 RepID=A0AAP0KTQ7_9MAGN